MCLKYCNINFISKEACTKAEIISIFKLLARLCNLSLQYLFYTTTGLHAVWLHFLGTKSALPNIDYHPLSFLMGPLMGLSPPP